MPDSVTVRAGSKMVIEAIVAGKPAPHCKWKQGNEDVLTSDRLSVVKTLTSTTLIIKNVTRKDSGYYSLSAENSTGKINQILRVTITGELEQELYELQLLKNNFTSVLKNTWLCTCKSPSVCYQLCILDIPGPPEAPLEITEQDIDACTLLWNSPQEDGGSNITNYIVEKCDISQGDWVTVSTSCTKTSFRMTKLTPGKEYGFRVRAENRFGVSEPTYFEKMIARYPFGENLCAKLCYCFPPLRL